MKRIGHIYENIISIENLERADKIAQRGKRRQYGVRQHNKNREANIQALHEILKARGFRTSQYSMFKVYEPKERDVYSLPFFPDRIVHHAIMTQLESILMPVFTADTYSCIRGRGIHKAVGKLKKHLKNAEATKFCLKLDIKKFYPSVDHAILKQMLRKKIKDNDTLNLLDEIIDSAEGLPIGNLLSQSLSTFYLTYFDHWVKENLKVKMYFRYADDIVILADNKPQLHYYLSEIKKYLSDNLKLTVKENYQVFPVESRGIDFLGYVAYHSGYVRLRPGIKHRFARMLAKKPNAASIASYMGWAKHCKSKHLLKKLLTHEQLQRLRDNSRSGHFHRRENQDSQNPGQRHSGKRFQSSAFQV